MEPLEQQVYIVDDDDAIRDSLVLFLESSGLEASAWARAEDFLAAWHPDMSGCLLLDLQMPETTGLDLQQELEAVGSTLPIIFITGHGDVPTAVQALKAGAFDFLQKPFDHLALLQRVNKAFALDRQQRHERRQQREVRQRLDSLTPREREVLEGLVQGKASKVIAIDLELSQRTVEIYRANVMRKMQARSLVQLIKQVGTDPIALGDSGSR